VFSEDFKTVVGGSNHGAVYVFDRKWGVRLHVLHHADSGMVQTVTVCGHAPKASTVLIPLQTHDLKEKSTIISVLSSHCGEISICVWNRRNKAEETAKQSSNVVVKFLAQLLALAIIIFVVCLSYQWLMVCSLVRLHAVLFIENMI
jgi:hypothetical protein